MFEFGSLVHLTTNWITERLPVFREAIAISTLVNAHMPANLSVKRACVHYRINALPSRASRSICAADPREAGGTLKA
jgi:hypothetical protein